MKLSTIKDFMERTDSVARMIKLLLLFLVVYLIILVFLSIWFIKPISHNPMFLLLFFEALPVLLFISLISSLNIVIFLFPVEFKKRKDLVAIIIRLILASLTISLFLIFLTFVYLDPIILDDFTKWFFQVTLPVFVHFSGLGIASLVIFLTLKHIIRSITKRLRSSKKSEGEI